MLRDEYEIAHFADAPTAKRLGQLITPHASYVMLCDPTIRTPTDPDTGRGGESLFMLLEDIAVTEDDPHAVSPIGKQTLTRLINGYQLLNRTPGTVSGITTPAGTQIHNDGAFTALRSWLQATWTMSGLTAVTAPFVSPRSHWARLVELAKKVAEDDKHWSDLGYISDASKELNDAALELDNWLFNAARFDDLMPSDVLRGPKLEHHRRRIFVEGAGPEKPRQVTSSTPEPPRRNMRVE